MSVSVVIPVYNGAEFVAETIESVYAQTAPAQEVIVIDDGSTDDTPAVLRQFEGRPGYRMVRRPNGREASARNAGVQLATGDFVAFLDHDDLWKPTKLERQLAMFDPAWGMSFTAYDLATETGTEFKRLHDTWDPDPQAVIRTLGPFCSVGPPSTTLVRRSVLQTVGPFEQVVPFGDDWLMWLRVAAAGHQIGYLPESLAVKHFHGGNLGGDDRGYYDCACDVYDRYGNRRLRAWWRLNAACDAHDHQDRRRARRRILQAARIRPWAIRPAWVRLLY